MALLAEQLVDEWLNRQGFVTLRGIRRGNAEVDLLGIRQRDGRLEGWHVEVQVSFRPIGYLGRLTAADRVLLGVANANSAKARPQPVLERAIAEWVDKKFTGNTKRQIRESCWPDIKWAMHLVHGVVRDPAELQLIEKHGVSLVPLKTILEELCFGPKNQMFGAAGTDIAELLRFYGEGASTYSAATAKRPAQTLGEVADAPLAGTKRGV